MAIGRSEGFRQNLPSYPIDSTLQDTWEAGQPASFASDSADSTKLVVRPTATVAGGAPDTTHTAYAGIFWGDKTSQTTDVVIEEAISFSDPSNDVMSTKHRNIVSGSVRATKNDSDRTALSVAEVTIGSTPPTFDGVGGNPASNVDVAIDITAGRVAINPSGNAASADPTEPSVILLTYRWELTIAELNISEFGAQATRFPDDTLGTNLATIATGRTVFATDQYDTQQTYSVGALLKIDANNRWSTASLPGAAIARVLRPPTASNRLMLIEVDFSLASVA